MNDDAKPAEAWLEVNIRPPRETILIEVVDLRVHDVLEGAWETWFFFWEPELRLRFRWRDPKKAERLSQVVTEYLDGQRAAGAIGEWHRGAHGATDAVYEGEANEYGTEVWELIQKDWMSGSELALAIVKLESQGFLTKPREYHWQRRVHLFTNQAFVSQNVYETWLREAMLCLQQANGYVGQVLQLVARPSSAPDR